MFEFFPVQSQELKAACELSWLCPPGTLASVGPFCEQGGSPHAPPSSTEKEGSTALYQKAGQVLVLMGGLDRERREGKV